jgi:signal transduction histidine kinase
MGPLVLLTMFIGPYSVYRRLRPLARAAQQADTVMAMDRDARFALSNLPREAASFAAAINRLMDRIGELVQSQKSFISRAAHELRTPLSVMLLELDKIADPRARRLTADVMNMSDIVNRLLELARIDATTELKVVDIDLAVITQRALDGLEPLAQARHTTIKLDVVSPQMFTGDSASIYEALRNLLENAIKHTPSGATIRIKCGPGLAWLVEDDGNGFPEGDVQALFEPFHRGRTNCDGAGLGLSIVKQTMDIHNATIEVGRSAMGGARFCLQFSPGPPDFRARPRNSYGTPNPERVPNGHHRD